MMLMNQYQEMALRTRSVDAEEGRLALVNAALGLAGEAGEVAEIVKKLEFHKHPRSEEARAQLIDEAGDILWYIALLGFAIQCPLEEIASRNIEKLRQRYPEGFDAQRSAERYDPLKIVAKQKLRQCNGFLAATDGTTILCLRVAGHAGFHRGFDGAEWP